MNTTLRKLTIAVAGGALAAAGAMTATTASATEPQEPVACTGSQLTLGVEYGDSGMGHSTEIVRVTNVSNSTCSVFGHPNVSRLDKDNLQIGAASRPATDSEDAVPVDLAPGASATATITTTNAGNFDAETCRPVDAAKLRIVGPNGPDLFDHLAVSTTRTCANPEVQTLQTTPFVA